MCRRNCIKPWRSGKNDPTIETNAITLQASQALVIPKFVSLPGGRDIRTLVFLEDNDVVAQRAIELSANSLPNSLAALHTRFETRCSGESCRAVYWARQNISPRPKSG